MIEIDGSYGEGGGQIVRSAVALSAVTGRKTRVFNIRKNRPNPGLKAQHVKAIETSALICGAKVEGLSLGSDEITFSPVEMKGGRYEVDIGTAGSISLLLQCIMPAAAYAKESMEIIVRGGTDVAWSPTIDYLKHVTLKALSNMGYRCQLELLARGYYPRGGGKVRMLIEPSRLKPFEFIRQDCTVQGTSHCSNLPEHVADRQASSAARHMEQAGIESHIETTCSKYSSTGSGITLWCDHIGASALGKRGLPAEDVGKMAAEEMVRHIRSGAAVDTHLADQLIPYMGLCGGGSYTTAELSEHTSTNIWVTRQFLDVEFEIKKVGELVEVCLK